MAAFSYQNHPFLLDSIFLPNSPIKISGSEHEGSINTNNTAFFSQFNQSDEPVQEIHVDVEIQDRNCVNSDNELSVTKKLSTESLLVVDKLESGEEVTQKIMNSMEKKRKSREGSCLSSVQSKDAREGKNKKQRKCNDDLNDVEERKTRVDEKDQEKVPEEIPKGYIHVRARRGQATDSHSLAERVRREKISERMKLLQALVPGCDKVTGKALMLDEIINYVQSLQSQVEFLSMKLASLNPIFYDFGVDLDAFIVRPESLSQECSPTQVSVFADATTNTFTTPTSNYFHDSSLLLQQGQRLNPFSQDNGSQLWDADDQRQKLINQAGLISNNMCSFN